MSKPPVVVQGTSVASPYDHNTTAEVMNDNPVANPSEFTGKGEKQESRCRDPFFAILLYANVAAIAAVVGAYGTEAFSENTGSISDYSGYAYAVLVMGAFSLVVAGLMLLVLMRIPKLLIKASLIFVVAMSLVWAVVAFIDGQIALGIIGLIFFLIGLCYARAVWSRIPFATANLITACTAVKSNCGITIVSYFFVAVAFGWSLLWTVALAGVYDKTTDCRYNANGIKVCEQFNYGYLFLLLLSYFFTHQVIQNTVHVTVAGTVGTWWFAPEEASSCCSEGVRGSMVRSLTTSFGSICFGSLIVALIQALRQLAHAARDDGGALACIAECILGCLESLVEYFNKWAYVYVGLYGYSYLEAGKNVFTLFKNRGWDAIIADDLVGNTLFLVSLIVGGLAGCIGLALEASTDWFENTGDSDPQVAAFVLGLIVGLVLTSIFMSVVGSAVNAVIVLFAEAPAEFQQNYPELSQQMRETWLEFFPASL